MSSGRIPEASQLHEGSGRHKRVHFRKYMDLDRTRDPKAHWHEDLNGLRIKDHPALTTCDTYGKILHWRQSTQEAPEQEWLGEANSAC